MKPLHCSFIIGFPMHSFVAVEEWPGMRVHSWIPGSPLGPGPCSQHLPKAVGAWGQPPPGPVRTSQPVDRGRMPALGAFCSTVRVGGFAVCASYWGHSWSVWVCVYRDKQICMSGHKVNASRHLSELLLLFHGEQWKYNFFHPPQPHPLFFPEKPIISLKEESCTLDSKYFEF